jgi:hypothetical protein
MDAGDVVQCGVHTGPGDRRVHVFTENGRENGVDDDLEESTA